MTYRPPFVSERFTMVQAPHPASLEEAELLKHCSIEIGRVSGPGGQNRNRRDTAVWIQHTPTGFDASGTERRSQAQNRSQALRRLRRKLAVRLRVLVNRDRPVISELWRSRRQGDKLSVNPEHDDYPALLAQAMDIVQMCSYQTTPAATWLGVSPSHWLQSRRAWAEMHHTGRRHCPSYSGSDRVASKATAHGDPPTVTGRLRGKCPVSRRPQNNGLAARFACAAAASANVFLPERWPL